MPSSGIFTNSKKTEWYTPINIIDAVKRVFIDGIELDVCSSKDANEKIIKAQRFFTKEYDGLAQKWNASTVWMNHPYGDRNEEWVQKLVDGYLSDKIGQAMCITYNSTETKWFRPLHSFYQCYLYKRVSFVDPTTLKRVNGSQKGNVITYLGADILGFVGAFKELGSIKQELGYKKDEK